MNKDLVISGFTKIFSNNILTDDELSQVKELVGCSFFLPDILEDSKQLIFDSTVDTINDVFKQVFVDTIDHSFQIRYGV